MNHKLSRRMMLKGTSVAALALHGSDIAAGIPASLFEGNHTPKICLEAGMGDLPPAPGGVASDEVVAAASRRIKQLGVDHVISSGAGFLGKKASSRT